MWGTYFGGGGDEGTVKMICDTSGNIYLAGETNSIDSISSGTFAHQASFASPTGYQDGYLAKFNSSGSRQWSTYYGGSGNEFVFDLDLDTLGNVYVVGATSSDTGIATPGSFVATRRTGYDTEDGFIVKFNSSGSRLWATYFAESQPVVEGGKIMVNGLDIDNANNIYICGSTSADSFFATAGLDTTLTGQSGDGFLAKFDVTGARKWTTYVGGSGGASSFEGEVALDVSVASNGRLYVLGLGASDTSFTTAGAWKATPVDVMDIGYFLAEYDTSGVKKWATLLGGPDFEYHTTGSGGNLLTYDRQSGGISASPNGPVYFAMQATLSTTGIATPGAHQTTHGGGDIDGVLGCMLPDTTIAFGLQNSQFCAGQSFNLNFIATSFSSTNTFTAQLSNSSGSFSSPTTLGTIVSGNSGIISCTLPGTLSAGTYKIRITASNPSRTSHEATITVGSSTMTVSAGLDTAVCEGDTIKLNASSSASGASYSWTGPASFTATTQTIKRTSATTAMSGNYIVTMSTGCPAKDTVYVTVNAKPATPDASYNSPLCVGDTLRLSATVVTGASYSWTGPGSFIASVRQPEKLVTQLSDSGFYIVRAKVSGCSSSPDTIKVNLNSVALDVNVSPNDTICEGTSVTFTATSQTGSATPAYQWYKGTTNVSGVTSNTYTTSGLLPTDGIIYCSITVSNVCANAVTIRDTVRMLVKPLPNINASSNIPVCTGDTLKLFAASTSAGSPTYGWTGPSAYTSVVQNPIRTSATTAMVGDYIVTGTLDGCSTKDTVTVVVNTTPAKPTVSYNSPLCMGDTLRLSASTMTGVTYSWTGGNSFTSSIRTPEKKLTQYIDSGFYFVSAVANGCTSAHDSIKVIINSVSLDVSVSPSDTVCEADPVTFTAIALPTFATKTYQWYKGITAIGGATSAAYSGGLLPADAIVYCRTNFSNVCANTVTINDTVRVHVKPLPVPVATSNSPVCTGDTIKLFSSATPSAGVGYGWTGPGSFTSTSQNPIRVSATTGMAGDYIVTASLQACSFRDTVTVMVNTTLNKPTASYNSLLCVGDTLRLSASVVTGASYSWTGPNSFSSSIRTPEKLITQLSDSGFYIVKAIANGCNSLPDTAKVKLNTPLLDVSVTPNDTICEYSPVTFSAAFLPASASPSYQWYKGVAALTGATSGSHATSALAAGDSIIYCRITVNNVCANTVTIRDTMKMHVKPLPNINATSNSPVCSGDTLKPFASSTSAGSVSYNWAGPGAFSSAAQNPVLISSTTAMTGSYVVTATLQACNANDTVAVIVNSTPATPIASADTFVCVGDTLHLSASTVTGAIYLWTGPGGFVSQSRDTFRTNIQTTYSGAYVVKAVLGLCYSAPDTAWVASLSPSNLDVEILALPGTAVRSTDTVTLEAILPNGGVMLTYKWYKNGVLQPTDTSAIWKTIGLTEGDTVVVVVTTTYPCALTTVAKDTIAFQFAATVDRLSSKGSIKLYPNPNKGSFVVEGLSSKAVDVVIVNAIGQIVYRDKVSTSSGTINVEANLAVGHYLLKVHQEGTMDILKFNVLN